MSETVSIRLHTTEVLVFERVPECDWHVGYSVVQVHLPQEKKTYVYPLSSVSEIQVSEDE